MTARVEKPRSATASSINPPGSSPTACASGSHSSGSSTPGLRLNLGDLEPNHIRPHHHKRQLSATGTGFPYAGPSPPLNESASASEKATEVRVKGANDGAKQDEKANPPQGQRGIANRSPTQAKTSRYRPGMTHSTSSPQLTSTRHLADYLEDSYNSTIPPPSDARKHRHQAPPTISVGSAPSPSRSVSSSSGGVLVSTVRDRANRGQAARGPARSDSLNDLKGGTEGMGSDPDAGQWNRPFEESALDDDCKDLDNR